jgi:hypothetical protein
MMTTLLSVTHPDIESLQVELLRRTPAWRRLEMVGELNATVRLLALSGLQQRHPGASPEALRRMLAGLVLGEVLAAQVYGENSHAN